MRDPQGRIELQPNAVVRKLTQKLPLSHFLRTELARTLVQEGLLVDFNFHDEYTLQHPRIPFVTHPYEWCNAQFYQAAAHTLHLSELILDSGYELKDASAWNIIFDRGRPIFCDHLSFATIENAQWWAFGQYVRHFILPLVTSQYRGIQAQDIFKIHRDGLPPDSARQMLGAHRWVTRYWPLMLKGPKQNTPSSSQVANSPVSPKHHGLYAISRWFLHGLRPQTTYASAWVDYTQTRSHYSATDSQQKAQTVYKWLHNIQPKWVTDLGCNTGEYSHIACEAGAQVISIDLDHESIQTLYNTLQGRSIYPVVANLDDLSGGRGWAGRELPGLIERLSGKADAVLMLALVHHLAISSSIPYEEIAALSAQLTQRYAIVELLQASDPLVQQLAAQRQRSAEEFGIECQLQAFERHYYCRERQPLANGNRSLFLFEKK